MKIRFNQPEHKVPNDDRGIRIQYGEAKRSGKSWRWYLILIVSSLPFLYLISLILMETILVKADGRISIPQITVRTSVDGYIQQVFVKPLQTVMAGETVAVLENTPLESRYQLLTTEINFLNEEKNKLLLQSGNITSHSGQLLDFAGEQKTFYQKRLQQYETLFKQGAATQVEIATARNQYNGALENLASHERAQRLDQSLSAEIRQTIARINQLIVELSQVEVQKQQLLVTAPAEGLVTELFAQSGEYLSRGQSLLEIIFPEKAHISAFIPPKYQDYAVMDQTVSVTLPNGETAKARIISIPGVTQKSLAEGMNPLESPRSAILAHMQFVDPVKTRLINGMPVDIRFHHFSR